MEISFTDRPLYHKQSSEAFDRERGWSLVVVDKV
jgi:hypothetical protein